MDGWIVVRTIWTGLTGALGFYLYLEALYGSAMVSPWAALACVVVWLFLFVPSLAILMTSWFALQTAARSVLLYDAAVLALLSLGALLVNSYPAVLWFGGVLAVVGGLLAIEVAQARQEIGRGPDAGARAARYWIAALAAVWLTALLRVQGGI